jgi:ssDNA-binding Zn-finger/Zn-ribbon topoisomerase 1
VQATTELIGRKAALMTGTCSVCRNRLCRPWFSCSFPAFLYILTEVKGTVKHKKRKNGINPSAMRCQYCGGTVVLRSADGIYHENHSHTMLYVCSNYPRCDAYVRTHPGTNIPVGTLANHELRTLRNQAHRYFDQLYLSGLMSKQDAYLWLAGLLQVPLSKAHIGFLGEYYCNEVIAESKKLLERRRKQQPAGFRPCKGGEAS